MVTKAEVFPAYAGMFLIGAIVVLAKVSFPRIRGDVPCFVVTELPSALFSPHTRGCSACPNQGVRKQRVFPAYAGMFRLSNPIVVHRVGFPRIRGDVPCVGHPTYTPPKFSPHTRGCSVDWPYALSAAGVFPAYAGMFRVFFSRARRWCGFPRIRGDVPDCGSSRYSYSPFSPHTRGCSAPAPMHGWCIGVFPAYAGMFLAYDAGVSTSSCFPRIRGDVPRRSYSTLDQISFSPHTRGCSGMKKAVFPVTRVFPAYAGMFRKPAENRPSV